MKLLKVVGNGFKAVGRGLASVGRAIADGASATGSFLSRHWAVTAAVVLGLIAFAAVTAALVFFWPATIGAIAGLSIALPAIGTIAPFAFLSTLSIPAAAAVVGAFAFGATLVGSAVINLFAAAYNGLDRFFNPAPRINRDAENEEQFTDEFALDQSARALRGLNTSYPQQQVRNEPPRRGQGVDRDHDHQPRQTPHRHVQVEHVQVEEVDHAPGNVATFATL